MGEIRPKTREGVGITWPSSACTPLVFFVFFCASSGSVSVVTERIRSEGGCGLGQLLLLLSVCVGAGAMVLTQLT